MPGTHNPTCVIVCMIFYKIVLQTHRLNRFTFISNPDHSLSIAIITFHTTDFCTIKFESVL